MQCVPRMQKPDDTPGQAHRRSEIREARRAIGGVKHRSQEKENCCGQRAKNGAGKGSAEAEPD